MEKLLTIKECAKLLHLADITLYKMVYRREIPFVKIGRSVRFSEVKINAWLQRNSYDTIESRK
jgi:excisionase family DNA binding protein